jgi:hypothetical protein
VAFHGLIIKFTSAIENYNKMHRENIHALILVFGPWLQY